jgi:hypothetical protein
MAKKRGCTKRSTIRILFLNAPGEWDDVMRALLLLQAQQLERLVKSIKSAAVVGGSESLLRMLCMADARLETLYSGPWAAL